MRLLKLKNTMTWLLNLSQASISTRVMSEGSSKCICSFTNSAWGSGRNLPPVKRTKGSSALIEVAVTIESQTSVAGGDEGWAEGLGDGAGPEAWPETASESRARTPQECGQGLNILTVCSKRRRCQRRV